MRPRGALTATIAALLFVAPAAAAHGYRFYAGTGRADMTPPAAGTPANRTCMATGTSSSPARPLGVH